MFNKQGFMKHYKNNKDSKSREEALINFQSYPIQHSAAFASQSDNSPQCSEDRPEMGRRRLISWICLTRNSWPRWMMI